MAYFPEPAPSTLGSRKHVSYIHSAYVFAEVRVDEDLGVVRVTGVVTAIAAGRILSPKTARSEILGGAVMGISRTCTRKVCSTTASAR